MCYNKRVDNLIGDDMIVAGQRVESLNCGWVVALEDAPIIRGVYVKALFEDAGCEKPLMTTAFVTGNVRETNAQIAVGDVLKSTTDGSFEILKIESSRSIAVKFFNTGNIVEGIQKDILICGYVKDRVLKEDKQHQAYVEQQEREQARYDEQQRIAEERAAYKAMQAAKKADAAARKLLKQQQKQDYLDNKLARDREYRENAIKAFADDIVDKGENPKDVNIDFKDRNGNWVLHFGHKGEFFHTRLGRYHNNMTQRAGRGSTYSDVTIHADFLDPQKFCDWAVQQPGWGMGYCLEKDLLADGSREYGPDNSCFVPHCVNFAIIRNRHLTVAAKRPDGWFVQLQCNGLPVVLGTYDTQAEGVAAYKEYRQDYCKFLAEKYKKFISERAYRALLLWEA